VDHVKDIDTAAAAVVFALDLGGANHDHGFSFVGVFGDFEIDDLHAEDGFGEVENHSGVVSCRKISVICPYLLVNDLLACGVNELDCSLAHLGLEVDLCGEVSSEP
jgi:hypothetical protein